jgi:hypothetical protein
VVADIYVFGGAAMVLAYDAQRATRDIDAVFHPHGLVLDEARHVADVLGLPTWWLNEQASVYVSGKLDPGKRNVFDHPGLRVAAASPEHMLAMKVLSSAPETHQTSVSFSNISISQPPKTPSLSAAASSPTKRYLPEANCFWRTSSQPDQLGPHRAAAPAKTPPIDANARRHRSLPTAHTGTRRAPSNLGKTPHSRMVVTPEKRKVGGSIRPVPTRPQLLGVQQRQPLFRVVTGAPGGRYMRICKP